MSHIETLGQLADARAEIARLTAELTAARAVPADVETAIAAVVDGAVESGHATALNHATLITKAPFWTVPRLKAAIARAIAEARQPATVGGLLATAPVGAIVEADGGCAAWEQARVTVDDDGMEIPWRRRWMASKSWTTWRQGHPTAIRDFGRLVPASEADRDPATRGPLPKGG